MIRYREYGDCGWRDLYQHQGRLVLPDPSRDFRLYQREITDDEVCEAILRCPPHGAGTIKGQYASSPTALTVTALNGLASSSDFTAGWTSAYVDNTSNLYQNLWYYGQVVAGTSPTAGSARAYAYSYDGTNAVTFTSAGTPGSQGTLTVTDTENLDSYLVLLWSTDIDTSSDQAYAMPPRSMLQAFGSMPRNTAMFVSHSTVAALKTTLNAMYYDGSLSQYT